MITKILIGIIILIIFWIVGCVYFYNKTLKELRKRRDEANLMTIRGQAQKKVINRKIERLEQYKPWNKL